MIHELKRPFEGLHGRITAVTARDHLTVGDLLAGRRASATDETVQSVAMVACVCGLDSSEINSMDLDDYGKFADHVSKLLAPDDKSEGEDSPKG